MHFFSLLACPFIVILGVVLKKVYCRRENQRFVFCLFVGCVSLWYSQHRTLTMLSLFLGWKLSVVGLTGGIGTGKSTAAEYARDHMGYILIDADQIAREVVRQGTWGFRAIVSEFGTQVLDPSSGELDRNSLGQIVFKDPRKRRKLERITHPRILWAMLKSILLNRLLCRKKVLVDVPLLFEGSLLYYLCHTCILVDATVEDQISRVKARNPQLRIEDIQGRIQSQMSREDKVRWADFVVTNSSTKEELFKQLDLVL